MSMPSWSTFEPLNLWFFETFIAIISTNMSWLITVLLFASVVPEVWGARIGNQRTEVVRDEVELQTVEIPHISNELPALTQGRLVSSKTGRVLAAAAALFAVLFVVMSCRRLISSQFESISGAKLRSLAEGGAGTCESGSSVASSLLSALDLSAPETLGLTSHQMSLITNARVTLRAAIETLEDLVVRRHHLHGQMLEQEQKVEQLQLTEPGSYQYWVAKEAAAALKVSYQVCLDKIEQVRSDFSTWGDKSWIDLRALVIIARAGSTGRSMRPRAGRALALAERVTNTLPLSSAPLSPANLPLVRSFGASLVASIQRCRDGLSGARSETAAPNFSQQVQEALQILEDGEDLSSLFAAAAFMSEAANIEEEVSLLRQALGSAGITRPGA